MDPDELLKKLVTETRMLSQPIDFAELERRGVISKAGKTWYRLHNPHDLPEHAAKKIREVVQDANGIRVKFEGTFQYERLAKRFEKMAAKKGLL